jgi:hypothetical protein
LSQWGLRRFVPRWRRTGIVLAVVLLVALAWWVLAVRPWPFRHEPDSLARDLEAGADALADYGDRIEARLRLQTLEAAIADGRRSVALRPSYRLIEELLEPVIASEQPERRAEMQAELDRLLPDLTGDRGAARARIERLIEMLRSPAGPGRQGTGM